MTAATSNPCQAPSLNRASDRSAKRDILLIAAERYAEASADGFGGVELRALGEAAKAWVKSMKPGKTRVTRESGSSMKTDKVIRPMYGHWRVVSEPFYRGNALYVEVRCSCRAQTLRCKRVGELERSGNDQRCRECHTERVAGIRAMGMGR